MSDQKGMSLFWKILMWVLGVTGMTILFLLGMSTPEQQTSGVQSEPSQGRTRSGLDNIK